MEKIILVYLISINIVAVILTVYDKIAAKKRAFRISEATLILCGVLGGAACELIAMLVIRHKTAHIKFMLGLPLIILVHIAIILALKLILGEIYA